MRGQGWIRACAVLAVIAAAAVPAAAADDCSAEVRATPRPDLVTNEAVTKIFAVEVETREACADVTVEATIVERLFNGEEIRIPRRASRTVSNHTVTYRAEHRMAKDSTLLDSQFTVVRCARCAK